MSARDVIIEALDSLESENEGLRQLNEKIRSEFAHLQQENERLRHELERMRSDQDAFKNRVFDLEDANSALEKEVSATKRSLKEERKTVAVMQEQAASERDASAKRVEDLHNSLLKHEDAMRRAEKEVSELQSRLEKSARKNYSDRDVELLHELEQVKQEKRVLSGDNDELERLNKRLKKELNEVQVYLDEKEAELKNESRRHTLLTKEFNSLLEENSHLKLQIRRRGSQPSLLAPKSNAFASESSDNLAALQQDSTDESVQDLRETPTSMSMTSRAINKSSKYLAQASTAREPSLIINNHQPTHDYPFPRSNRDATAPGNGSKLARMPSTMTSREPSLVRRGGNFSVREGKKGGRPNAAKSDERTTPETMLPALTPSPSSGGTASKGTRFGK